MREYIESNINDNKVWKGQFNLCHSDENDNRLHNLFKKFSKYAIAKEGGGLPGKNPQASPHYHFFCVLHTAEAPLLASFKKEIRLKFPELKREGKGGEHKYTVSPPKLTNDKQYKNYLTPIEQKIKQVCYTMKDITEKNIPLSKEFTKKQLFEIRDLYYELNQNNIDLKIKEENKVQLERTSIVKILIEKIKIAHTTKDATGSDYFRVPNEREIVHMVCQHFIKNFKTMNQNVITNLVETIQNILKPSKYEEYLDKIVKNLSYDNI